MRTKDEDCAPAVRRKTRSDVSRDRSVSPPMSVAANVDLAMVSRHFVSIPATPLSSDRDIPVDPAGGHCYRGPI